MDIRFIADISQHVVALCVALKTTPELKSIEYICTDSTQVAPFVVRAIPFQSEPSCYHQLSPKPAVMF